MGVASHYLKIRDERDQLVLGESEGHGHLREIDVTGWNWSVADATSKAQRSAGSPGSGAAASNPPGRRGSGAAATSEETGIQPTLFSFSKPVDMSTVRLMKAMNNGEIFKTAMFILIQENLAATGLDARELFRLEVLLKRVKVVGYSLNMRSSEFRVDLEEDWELNYENVTFMLDGAGYNYQETKFERPAGSRVGSSPRPPATPQPPLSEEDVERIVRRAATARRG